MLYLTRLVTASLVIWVWPSWSSRSLTWWVWWPENRRKEDSNSWLRELRILYWMSVRMAGHVMPETIILYFQELLWNKDSQDPVLRGWWHLQPVTQHPCCSQECSQDIPQGVWEPDGSVPRLMVTIRPVHPYNNDSKLLVDEFSLLSVTEAKADITDENVDLLLVI